MKIVAYLERPASNDPGTRDHELWHADRIRRLDGRVMIAVEVGWLATLLHNLAIGGFGALMFRAGDNHGFHMGADDLTQCTCQWAPGRGEPYRPSSRCEQEDDEDYDDRYGPERACSCGNCFRDADDIGFPCDSCGGIVQ